MSEEEQAVQQLNEAMSRVKHLARGQYTPRTCPLNTLENDHRELSQALWGCGCWQWDCKFCGEGYSE